MVCGGAGNRNNLWTMVHVTADKGDIVLGAAVNPYTLWTILHITAGHGDVV